MKCRPDCHLLAEKEVLRALVKAGVLIGGLEELIAAELGPIFFPHGLGHLIGCDTHDVGGYLPSTPTRMDRAGLNKVSELFLLRVTNKLIKLRTARVLQHGMLLTVEPGCYFIDMLIRQALADPVQSAYIDVKALDRFKGFGGVRLEDVVYVTAEGVENLVDCGLTQRNIE